MAIKVLVPRLGEGVEEVTVTRWLKHEGDRVDELEPLLEVNTDKVDTEIPSPASGTVLRLSLSEGTPAKVGQVLAWIGQPGESLPADAGRATTAESAPTTVAQQPAAGSAPREEVGFISPVVARIAADRGVDLRRVRGTGLGGRITKNDVLAFAEGGTAAAVSPSPPSTDAPAPASGDSLVPLTAMRRQIAGHMVHSKQTSPHVLTVIEADLSRVTAHRDANKDALARHGLNLTFTAYFAWAVIAGLRAHPLVNASWSDAGIVIHGTINLGLAVSLGEQGLIVPVIRNAAGLSLSQVAGAVNDLANRARARKLQPEEVRGGTFTLTNHGVSGSLFAMPIINQPQAGILGVGAIQKRVVVVGDAIAIRPMVYLSFVFDHRILDGVSGDRFLSAIKEILENWS